MWALFTTACADKIPKIRIHKLLQVILSLFFLNEKKITRKNIHKSLATTDWFSCYPPSFYSPDTSGLSLLFGRRRLILIWGSLINEMFIQMKLLGVTIDMCLILFWIWTDFYMSAVWCGCGGVIFKDKQILENLFLTFSSFQIVSCNHKHCIILKFSESCFPIYNLF